MSYTSETAPLRKKEDIIKFLVEHDHYHPMNSWNGGFCVAWNVKMHGRFDMTGMKHAKEHDLDPTRTEAWEAHLESKEGQNVWDWAMENIARQFIDGEFTRYPGVGHVKCYFNGRSGGWMVLEDTDIENGGDNPWALNKFIWSSRDSYEEWLREMNIGRLTRWYRMVCDVDRAVAGRYQEAEYQYAFERAQWEDEQRVKEAVEADPAVQTAKQNIAASKSVIDEREMHYRAALVK
jgi:hypothetical protein